ncbi:MAG: thiolase domain-containing protein, partial [Nitrospinota bacterium]|nr:thiolase domain-containing protein [Nitrospinota bacterium]
MKKVYLISGGVTKFSKANPEKDFRFMVREAYDHALSDVPKLKPSMIDGSVISYFSDHFTRQLMS